MRFLAIGAIATAIAIGAVVVTTGGGGGGSGASWYISPSGSDANPGTTGSPFLTMDKCYQAASPGDTCFLKAGTFGSQTIPDAHAKALTSTCRWASVQPWQDGTTTTQDLSGCVTFKDDTGATPTIHDLTIEVPYVYLLGLTFANAAGTGSITIRSPGNCESPNPITDIIVRNTTAVGFLTRGMQYTSFVGDTFDHLNEGTGDYSNTVGFCPVSPTGPFYQTSHFQIDSSLIENVQFTTGGQHIECIHTWTADHVNYTNDTFRNCAQLDISQQGDSDITRYVRYTNDVFDATCSHQFYGGTGGCNATAPGDNATNGGHSLSISRYIQYEPLSVTSTTSLSPGSAQVVTFSSNPNDGSSNNLGTGRWAIYQGGRVQIDTGGNAETVFISATCMAGGTPCCAWNEDDTNSAGHTCFNRGWNAGTFTTFKADLTKSHSSSAGITRTEADGLISNHYTVSFDSFDSLDHPDASSGTVSFGDFQVFGNSVGQFDAFHCGNQTGQGINWDYNFFFNQGGFSGCGTHITLNSSAQVYVNQLSYDYTMQAGLSPSPIDLLVPGNLLETPATDVTTTQVRPDSPGTNVDAGAYEKAGS